MIKPGNMTSEYRLTNYHTAVSAILAAFVAGWNIFYPDRPLSLETVLTIMAVIIGTGWDIGKYSESRGLVKQGILALPVDTESSVPSNIDSKALEAKLIQDKIRRDIENLKSEYGVQFEV